MPNESKIWNYLLERIGNPYGVAGLMGNLYAESGLNPENLQGTFNKKLGMTDSEYTAAVNDGSYTNFIHDSAGYGLAQWTYWSRKQNLLNYAKEQNASIGDLDMQLGFLWKELQSYIGVMNTLRNAKSVREASDAVLLKYERPADQSEAVQARRASYGQRYFDSYGKTVQSGGETKVAKNVMIGSAHIDERGKATGGKAGDQNGRELSVQVWYKHEKGWIVLRPKSREVGKKIAWDMQAACDNNHIGYDQSQRNTLYAAAKPLGFDCSRVTTDCETDCSSLVRVCICYAGIMVSAFSTESEVKTLVATGQFIKFTDKKYTTRPDYLRTGDVLVTATKGHTVVVLNDGALGGDDEPDDEPSPANPTNPDGSVRVTTSGTYWLREKPSILGKKICVVPDRTTLRVYGKTDNGWYGVKLPTGEKGYISGKALSNY